MTRGKNGESRPGRRLSSHAGELQTTSESTILRFPTEAVNVRTIRAIWVAAGSLDRPDVAEVKAALQFLPVAEIVALVERARDHRDLELLAPQLARACELEVQRRQLLGEVGR